MSSALIIQPTRLFHTRYAEIWLVKSQGNVAGLTEGAPDSESYGRYIQERTDGAVGGGGALAGNDPILAAPLGFHDALDKS